MVGAKLSLKSTDAGTNAISDVLSHWEAEVDADNRPSRTSGSHLLITDPRSVMIERGSVIWGQYGYQAQSDE